MGVIEDGIPIPKKGRPLSKLRLQLESMQIGQSMILPTARGNHNTVIQAAKKDTGHNFITRNLPEGRRIWRVS